MSRDAVIAEIARRCRGPVRRRDLLAAGLSPSDIDRRLARGALHRYGPGLYLVGHAVPPPWAPERAALLLASPDAALSHHTAAFVSSFLRARPRAVHLTAPGGARPRSRPGLHVHRAALPPEDVTTTHGLRITTPARTLLDLAAGLDDRRLRALVHEARVLRLTTEPELRAQLARAGRVAGVRTLRAVVSDPHVARNHAERLLLALLRRIGAEPTATNADVLGHEVDVLFAGHRLLLELDGFGADGDREAFENDRVRDALHAAAGYRTIRVTWRELTVHPRRLERTILRALSA